MGSRLGKILRIDPRVPGASPDVYALGLRNPYRFSFDHETGDLLIGDVGGGIQEEIDFLVSGAAAGTANFGWNRFEGTEERTSNTCILGAPPGYVAPSLTYPHGSGSTAVMGGVVVRDVSMPQVQGRYLYADIYQGDIRSAVVGPSTSSGDGATGLHVDLASSFSEDARCRVYVTSLNNPGPVYRLEAENPAGTPACQTTPAPPAPPLPLDPAATDRVAPRLTSVTVSRHRFRVSSAATPGLARTRTPTGTSFRFSLSEKAEVTVRFYRATAGRRSRGRCLAATRRLRHARRCTRYPLRGTLIRRDLSAGRHLIRFTGRVGVRALPSGRYRAILRGRDGSGNVSAGRLVKLQVVSR
jgi:hypothetical protein